MKSLPARPAICTRPVHLFAAAHLILIPLLCGTLAAQISALSPSGNQPQRIDVKGKVVNSLTGETIARALVTMGSRSVLTDSDGAFAFDGANAQSFYFQVQKPGFFETAPRVLGKVESAREVLLKLSPAGLIHGKVIDENGDPVEEASVQIFRQQVVNGKRDWSAIGMAQTRDDGSYRIPNLRPGKYIISVVPSQMRNFLLSKVGYAETFFPKGTDRASAVPISISAGEQGEANIELAPVTLHKVTGVVIGPKSLAAHAGILGSTGQPVTSFSQVDPTTGAFEIRGVPRGHYQVRAMGFQEGAEPLQASTSVTVVNDLTGIVLVLHPLIKIPIEVVVEGSQATTSSSIPELSFVRLQAVLKGSTQVTDYSQNDGTKENNKMVLLIHDAGTYDVSVFANGHSYVRSARCGSVDLLSEPLVVPSSGISNPIEIVLRTDTGRIAGSVRNADSSGLLVAVPDIESNQPPLTWGFGPQGTFSSMPLAPGGYNVYAFKNSEEVEYANRDAMKAYRSKAVHVTVAAGQKAEITLDAIEPEP